MSATPITDGLRELLGTNVVLLSWPRASKGTRKKWSHLTVADMTAAYLRKCEQGNIGVALGEISGGLIAIDVDDDRLVPAYLAANPFMGNTLASHGARGRVFWLRMEGDYHKRTVKLKTHSGVEVGEWRAGTNTQSIIHGIHPDGHAYQIVNRVKPLTVSFNQIVWPTIIANPPIVEASLPFTDQPSPDDEANDTQRHRHSDTQDTQDTQVVLHAGCFSTIEAIVDHSLPDREHTNNDKLFLLARGVKTLERLQGKFTLDQKVDVFNRWYLKAGPFLRKEQSRGEYLTEFMHKIKSAKLGLDESSITQAWEQVQKKPLPPEAVQMFGHDGGEITLIVALCRELQIKAGGEPFFLSCRTLAKLLGHETHIMAARRLGALCEMEFIREETKGTIGPHGKASCYRYLKSL